MPSGGRVTTILWEIFMEQSTSKFKFLAFVSEEEKKLDLKKRVDIQSGSLKYSSYSNNELEYYSF